MSVTLLYFNKYYIYLHVLTLTNLPVAQPESMLKAPQINIPKPNPIVLIIGTTQIFPVDHRNPVFITFHSKFN